MTKEYIELMEAAVDLLDALDEHLPRLREQMKGEWIRMELRFEPRVVEAYRRLDEAVDFTGKEKG